MFTEADHGHGRVVGHFDSLFPLSGVSENGIEHALCAGRDRGVEARWEPPSLMGEFERLPSSGEGNLPRARNRGREATVRRGERVDARVARGEGHGFPY